MSKKSSLDLRNRNWLDLGLLIARVGVGGTLILRHGLPKIPVLLTDPTDFLDPIGLGPAVSLALAILAEVLCALAVVVGLWCRQACVVLSVNFAVIVNLVHRLQIPEVKGELALLYLFVFLALLLTGPGRYSLDYRIRSRRDSAE